MADSKKRKADDAEEVDKRAEKNRKLAEEAACCSICLDVFLKPQVGGCGHSFCLPCIHDAKLQHMRRHTALSFELIKQKCPLCKAFVNFRPNFALENVLMASNEQYQARLERDGWKCSTVGVSKRLADRGCTQLAIGEAVFLTSAGRRALLVLADITWDGTLSGLGPALNGIRAPRLHYLVSNGKPVAGNLPSSCKSFSFFFTDGEKEHAFYGWSYGIGGASADVEEVPAEADVPVDAD